MYDVAIIGAGFSGICMAIELKKKGIENFCILEKSDSLGGTWHHNTYPGAECDIPSALYSYSFEPYPHWEYKWSHQDQILEYLKYCASNYDINKHIILGSEIQSAQWKDNCYWELCNSFNKITKAKVFVPAIGQLHHPSWPNIPGKEDINIPTFHSAQWDHSISLTGKRVGVIGNAASAVQFIPEIAKEAKKVIVFQRSANWMLPKQDRMYRNWEKKLVAKFPALLKMYRLKIWLLGGALFLMMKKGNSLLRSIYQKKCINYIKKHIKEPKLVEQLTPKFPLGAKRLLFSDNYYEALSKEHVHLEVSPIEKIAPNGVGTKNKVNHELDVLIYSTGFITNPFLKDIEVFGKKGMNIKSYWKKGPKNYLGITMEHFPNLFMMYGPNTNLGHNSIIIMSEAQAKYIAAGIHYLLKTNNKSLEVKGERLEKYYEEIQGRLKNMIWAIIDNSWYQSSDGSIPNNWPGRTLEYIRRTKHFNKKDYVLK